MKMNTYFLYRVMIILSMIILLPDSGQAQTESPSPQATPNHVTYIPLILYHPGEPNIFGIEMESDWDENLLDLAHNAGIHWVRRNGILWNEIETVEGIRDWSRLATLESEMALLRQKHMQMILIVRGVPDWAQTENGNVCGPIAQDRFAAFATFMSELVNRYSQPPYNIRYWEIGNEPDFPYTDRDIPFGCWGDSSDPYYGGSYYGEMLKVVYPVIKQSDPQAQVLVGGLLLDCDPENPPPGKDCTSSKFLEGILLTGAGSAFDGVSFHSYDYYNGSLGSYGNSNWMGSSTITGPILDLKANYLTSVLEHYNLGDKYLLNTENALLCNQYPCDETFEQTKAIYVAQSYADGLASKLDSVIWYSYTGSWQSTRLVHGAVNPLPAYYALQAANQILDGMAYNQTVPIEYMTIYEFIGQGDRNWIVWSKDGQTHSLTLPALPIKMWDVFGTPIAPQLTVEIGIRPIYIEWEN